MSSRVRKYDRNEKTRSERKGRWIRVKNLMRKYSDCNYGNLFYCNHVYDATYPWVWVDFRFFHTRLKRYYAVAMVTAEYEAYCNAEEKTWNISSIIFPNREPWPKFKKDSDLNAYFNRPDTESDIIRKEFEALQKQEILDQPAFISPKILLKDYGPVAIGCLVTVNTPHIDEHVIREFITHFRSLGEPTTPGWSWKGPEVQVDPKRLDRI